MKYDEKSEHYRAGGLETIEIIKAKLTPEQYTGYLLGNVIKYATRMAHRGEELRDLEKLRFYVEWLQEYVQKYDTSSHQDNVVPEAYQQIYAKYQETHNEPG